ncbi:MAG: 4Fe-4S dicluster domain-containing protein, partial [Promethearchaeota archaeon]
KYICLAKCMCKTRTEFMGIRECKSKYPLETCMPLNQAAIYYIERNLGREISKKEAKELCKEFNKMGLIYTTENFSDGMHTLLCNCCPCCCNILGGIIKWDNPHSVAAANYVAEVKTSQECERCETCVEICLFKAIKLNENGPEINIEKCMGCGLCVVNCPSNVIDLKRIEKEVMPKNFLELGLKIGREMD